MLSATLAVRRSWFLRFTARGATAAFAFALAACAGDTTQVHTAAPVPAGPPEQTASAAQTTFVLTIPKRSMAGANARRPSYVSASTASITMTLTAASALTPAQLSSYPVATFNVTLGSGSCPGTGPWTCTFSVAFPAGSDTLAVTAYDGANGAGNVLSRQSQSFTLHQGHANSVSLTLDGQAGSAGCPSPSIVVGSPVTGAQCSGSSAGTLVFSGTSALIFPVTVKDQAGNTIPPGGTGAPVISVSTTGSIVASATPSSNPSRISVTPSGTGGSGTMTVTASGTSGSTDGVTQRSVTVQLQADAQVGSAGCGSPAIAITSIPAGASGSECSGSSAGTIVLTGASALTFPVTLKYADGTTIAAGSAGAPVLSATQTGGIASVSVTQNPYAVVITPTSHGTGTVTVQAAGATSGDGVAAQSVTFTIAIAPYWSYVSSMGVPRAEMGSAVVGNVIYVTGGYNAYPNGVSKTLEAYDATSDTWTTKANMPTASTSLAAAAIGTTVYAVGGLNASYVDLKNLQAYDTTTNTWTAKANMPTARDGLGAAVVNNILYAIGGFKYSTRTLLGTVEAYDPSSNTWSTKASMPTAREYMGIAVYNNIIYAFGGDNSNYLTTVEAYDPSSNTWSTKAPMPAALDGMGAATFNNLIYSTGGGSAALGYVGRVYVYDPTANTWTATTSLEDQHGNSVAGVANGKLFAIGGYTTSPTGAEGSAEVLHP